MNRSRIAGSLSNGGRLTCLAGGACLALTLVAFLGTAFYEWIVPPTDMHLPGLLTAIFIFYLAPTGCALLVLGGLAWLGGALLGRRSGSS